MKPYGNFGAGPILMVCASWERRLSSRCKKNAMNNGRLEKLPIEASGEAPSRFVERNRFKKVVGRVSASASVVFLAGSGGFPAAARKTP
jgi:hypothetical protein